MTSYDSWKLATPPEYEREEQDDDDVVVRRPCDVCQLLDCECFDAADGGEENDVMDPDKMMEPTQAGGLSMDQQQQIVNDWIDAAPLRELKRIKIRVETVVAKRRAENEQESKELSSWEKPHRETRSDKGTKRAKENAA